MSSLSITHDVACCVRVGRGRPQRRARYGAAGLSGRPEGPERPQRGLSGGLMLSMAAHQFYPQIPEIPAFLRMGIPTVRPGSSLKLRSVTARRS